MKKVLIIEDDAIQLKIYKEKFTKNGFEVITATDGKEGIEMARWERPDFIILDLVMPKIDGRGVLVSLKSDNLTKDIPVAILTVIQRESSNIPMELLSQTIYYWMKDKTTPSDIVSDVKKALE